MIRVFATFTAVALLAAGLTGCDELTAGPYAAPVLPPPTVVPPAMRPANPSLARIYFFRDSDDTGTLDWTAASLNGARVGSIGQGGYFYRDVKPDTYTITVRSEGIHSHQFATVTVPRGSTTFVQVYSIDLYGAQSTTSPFSYNGPATFADTVIPPGLAMARMRKLQPQE